MSKVTALPKKKERAIQEKLARILKGRIEVYTPIGRIDLLTENTIIEIKNAKAWKHALGQLVAYAAYYPKHKKKLYLFGYVSQTRKWDIELACKKFDVEVIFDGSVILT